MEFYVQWILNKEISTSVLFFNEIIIEVKVIEKQGRENGVAGGSDSI